MTAISIVIPVYNAEKYLRECFDSIIAQTLGDFEVLCVNDGSTDSSLEIIKEYAANDGRFIVLDKPNGGYGKAVNYGIDRANGEYLAIVEPDDFLSPEMLEVLYEFRTKGQGGLVDVIKGSYWEYFEGLGERRAMLARPVLDDFMPSIPKRIELNEEPGIFKYHPSIWSALYRLDFLRNEQIRFVEPPGAGWADNPFLAQTLVLAKTIWWVPIRGYYYRQTNSSASSFLKDPRIPFDRLREMRAFLSEKDLPDSVMSAFYDREFNYIYDVVHVHGFSERDDNVKKLIDETLGSMDENIVLKHPDISPYKQKYYREAMMPPCDVLPHGPEISPDISLIVPIDNGDIGIMETISSIVKTPRSFECVFSFYGGNDRSFWYCKKTAEIDKRFRVVSGVDTYHDAINVGVDCANGKYFAIVEPGRIVDTERVCDALAAIEADGSAAYAAFFEGNPMADIVAFSSESGVGAAEGAWSECSIVDEIDENLYDCSNGFFVSHLPLSLCDYLISVEAAKQSGIRLNSTDGCAGYRFAAKMTSIGKPHFFTYQISRFKNRNTLPVSKYPEVFVGELPKARGYTEAAFALLDDLPELDDVSELDWENLALRAFVCDIYEASTSEQSRQIYEEYFERIDRFVSGRGFRAPLYYHDVDSFREFELIRNEGIYGYCFRRQAIERNSSVYLGNELEESMDSISFKVGSKIVLGAKRLLPTKFVSKISHRAH